MELQVTILVLNANEPQCAATVDAILAAIQGLPAFVQIVNDPFRTGVGATMRRGVAMVTTPWVLFTMADGSEDPGAVRQMIELCCTNSWETRIWAVWGDRWGRGTTVGYPRLRRLWNRVGNYLIAWQLGETHTDWTDLAKAYRTADLRGIEPWSDDFRCAIQIPLRVLRRIGGGSTHVRIVPMHWRERTAGTTSPHGRDLWRWLKTLWEETR